MRKHTKEELDILAKLLTSEGRNFGKRIENYTKSERKYLEKKCRFYNLESLKKITEDFVVKKK